MDRLTRGRIERAIAHVTKPFIGKPIATDVLEELSAKVRDAIRNCDIDEDKIVVEFSALPLFSCRVIFPNDAQLRAYNEQLEQELRDDDHSARARGHITLAMVMAAVPVQHRLAFSGQDIIDTCRALNRALAEASCILPAGVTTRDGMFYRGDVELDVNSLSAADLVKLARYRCTHAHAASEKVPR